MNSFVDVVDVIVSKLLSGNAASFALAKWGKALAVNKMFKHRTEIGLSELPLIMITRPEVVPDNWTLGEREYKHLLRFYFGFHQPDKSLAQDEIIQFEEAIEDDFLSYKESGSLPAGVWDIDSKAAINDEGYFHPVYFAVKDVEIFTARQL